MGNAEGIPLKTYSSVKSDPFGIAVALSLEAFKVHWALPTTIFNLRREIYRKEAENMEKDRIDNFDVIGSGATQGQEDHGAELARIAALRKKNFRRAIASAISFIVVSIILFSAQSFAYFSDDISSGANRIAAGNVDIDLVEMMDDGHGGQVTYTAPVSVMPATTYSKIVTVKNSGDLPVYIRVKLEKIASDPTDLPAGWENFIVCNINSDDWTFHNGYYYYKVEIKAGETTESLFDKVAFAAAMGNEFVGKTVSFKITSEATQSTDNGIGPIDAEGWPAVN